MLKGLMMDRPLLVCDLIEFGSEVHAATTLTSVSVEGGTTRQTLRETRARVAKLANALKAMGVEPGDRVATLAWNTNRHLELYFAISGIGAVCHTINPRLFPEQLVYIANHAQDKALFFDLTFVPLVEKLRDQFKTIRRYVVLTDREHMPAGTSIADLGCYEEFLAAGAPAIEWPSFDENTACSLCYTSGTTGEPKGALFSHRSTVLHALFEMATLSEPFAPDKPLLPVVPLFHVNAWGLPYTAVLSGSPLVMPGPRLDGASLFDLMDGEQVYSAWGVPTVWLGLLAEMQKRGRKPKGFSMVVIGGSAAPGPMIEAFERTWGVNVVHGWGMTEMSPVGAFTRLSPAQKALPLEERLKIKQAQGQRFFGVDFKIVDEAGRRLPHDGRAQGELFVRGPTVISAYFENPKASAAAFDKEGWFGTGDVAKVTEDGFLTLVDRTKDLVKSGGEWISSIDVEGEAMGCPGVAHAAVIGVSHPKWSERPLLIVVKAAGADPKKEDILAHLAKRLAKWQVPDDVVFVESLPLTATGKVSKKDLRARFKDFKLPE
jgi:fatty-acyl-CoA synthase